MAQEAHEPRPTTSQGFMKAAYLSAGQLERIFAGIARGEQLGLVCRREGTSVTQFTRRCKREPSLDLRSKKAYEERKRLLS